MARPLRFRRSPESWSDGRIREQLFRSLDSAIGARQVDPRFRIGADYEIVRFEMDNGDVALFAAGDGEAYWLGNTETPKALWRTEKYGWEAIPYHVARWCQRELLADLHDAAPWLEPYPHVSWFFLPVFMSKDGRETTRRFFAEEAAGFPDANRDEALSFYESFLRTGVLDEHREEMAGKLGTSEYFDRVRMAATMGEFTVAKLLWESGYEPVPEIEVTTGHSLDFRARQPGATGDEGVLVEVTRPQRPTERSANTAVAAVRETAGTKSGGQLKEHGGGAVLFVDCSNFVDDEWNAVYGERPEVAHRPAVVFRARPDGSVQYYTKGSVPLELSV